MRIKKCRKVCITYIQGFKLHPQGRCHPLLHLILETSNNLLASIKARKGLLLRLKIVNPAGEQEHFRSLTIHPSHKGFDEHLTDKLIPKSRQPHAEFLLNTAFNTAVLKLQ